MATVDDINAAKSKILDVVDQQIAFARGLSASRPQGQSIELIQTDLEVLRGRVFAQEYTGDLTSSKLSGTLEMLRVATVRLEQLSAKMDSATTFIQRMSEFRANVELAIGALGGDETIPP
jgi:hypothetical protein